MSNDDSSRAAGQRKGRPEPGLRERKKAQTRLRISNVATLLFLQRGFDRVTVAEVAEAAEVSTMTVFNHFARKEDLFLDRIPETVELFTGALRERAPGESPVAALRRMLLELTDQGHPLGGVGDFAPFFRVILESPALKARAREGVEELEDAVAAALDGTPRPRLTAALIVAAYRTVYGATAARLLAGERPEAVAAGHRELLEETFDTLERALNTGHTAHNRNQSHI